MGCCGEKRAALRTRATVTPPEAAARPARAPRHEPEAASDLVVEYRGDTPVLLRAGGSGRLYAFSPARRLRRVPARDARQLLRNQLLTLAPTDEEGRSNGTHTETVRPEAG